MHQRAGVLLLALQSAAVLGACGEADREVSTAILRDSAGVVIAESSAPAWKEGSGWRLSEEPVLNIGVLEGDPNYQMFRVSGATRLPDGRIAVANAGSHQLRFYDSGGRFLKAVGGDGEGPGEFRVIYGVWPFRGDSLIAWDEQLRRFGVFTSSGEFARNMLVEKSGMNPRAVGPFADGSLFSVDEIFAISGTGVQQQYASYLRHSPAGALLDSLGSFPTFRTIRIKLSNGGDYISNVGFGPRTAIASSADHFFVGTADSYAVGAYAPDGKLVRLIRWTGGDRAVTAADVERFKEERVREASDANEQRREREHVAQLPFAEEFPAYSDLRADRTGNLWVRAFDRPGYEGLARWLLFDSEGRMMGEVLTPEDLWILEIGDDYVLGVGRDEFDVEHVRMYRLLKD
jgi:hypothetical protein